MRAKATEQRAAQAARLGQATDSNSHRAAELSQQAQVTRVENQMRITSDRLPDYGVMHPRLKGATLPVGQVSERFNAFRKELEARSAVDPNNLVHLYERIVSEQKNIGSRTDLMAPTESLRLTSMEAYVRGYANLKGIQLPSEAEFYGGMQALGTPVGDAGAPPYGARSITPASLRNNGGVTNGVVGDTVTSTARPALPELSFEGRTGKLIQHAPDWGFGTKGNVPAGAAEQVGQIAQNIVDNAKIIKQGSWGRGTTVTQNALFYSDAQHIVVTQANGTFITILKNGSVPKVAPATMNQQFLNAKKIWKQ